MSEEPRSRKNVCKLFWLAGVVFAVFMSALCKETGALALPEDGFLWETGAIPDALPVDPRVRTVHAGEGFRLVVDRARARAGERWVEVLMVLDDEPGAQASFWKAELTDLATGGILASSTHEITARRTLLSTDVRRHALATGRLRVERHSPETANGVSGAVELFLGADPGTPAPAPGERVRIIVDRPDEGEDAGSWTVTLGVPFPAGGLWHPAELRLVDGQGHELPSQSEAVALWGRAGAVRWLRMDAEIPARGDVYLERRPAAAAPRHPVTVDSEDGAIIVRVAGAEYALAPGASPIRSAHLNGRQALSAEGARGLYVIDQQGRMAQAAADNSLRVEAAGPLAAAIRFEGFYRTEDGTPLARHITRVEFFAGRPSAAVTHTLVLTEDTNALWFKEVGWELAVAPGGEPEALCGVSPEQAADLMPVALGSGRAGVSLFQRDYVQFGGGEKRYQIAGLDAAGQATEVLAEGDQMGDWAALRGTAGGVLLACRFAARRHPKEFEVYADRIVLRLFSPRGGERLDFRPAALLERWNRGGRVSREAQQLILEHETNAAGWARTHEILVHPFERAEDTPALAARVDRQREPWFALVDPRWTYATRVLGPLYPEDHERFPAQEEFIAQAMNRYLPLGHERDQEYGFVDYFAGPHFNRMGRYRYRNTYAVRKAAWLLYARSGRRAWRQWAEGTNRTYHDIIMNHWDGEDQDHRRRGLYIIAPPGVVDRHPFYWDGQAYAYGGGGANTLNQFLWDYYLTGYRRAGEAAVDYAAGMRAWWSPGRRPWSVLSALPNLWLAYSATWDQTLRPVIEDLMQITYDPDGAVGLHRDAIPYRTTYKAPEKTLPIIQAWDLLGDRRTLDLATRLSAFTWARNLGRDALFSRFDKGGVGEFLYRQSGAPSIPAELLRAVRQAVAGSPHYGVSLAHFRLLGLPYALAVIAETEADRRPPASWAAYASFGYPAAFVVRKGADEALTLHLRGSGIRIETLGATPSSQLVSSVQKDYDAGRVYLPLDTPAGEYLITPAESEDAALFADGTPPIVIHAPEYWRPAPAAQKPPLRIFFRVPEQLTEAPAILFEAPSRLFDPAGAPFAEGADLQGWIDLPGEQPGLWSFEADEHHIVRVRNLPPFFAVGSPESYFVPDLPWQADPGAPATEPPAPDVLFARGKGRAATDQALVLDGRRRLVISAGPPHASGDGGQFLPQANGTVEFFLKPFWDTFDLFPDGQRRLLDFRVPGGDWHLHYGHTGTRGEMATHVFDALLRGAQRQVICLRRAIVEKGRWIHVALEWGIREHVWPQRDRAPQQRLTAAIYINGQPGSPYLFESTDDTFPHAPLRLEIGHGMRGLVDGVRISDIRRYRGAFDAPVSQEELETDAHTRLLLRFDGTLEGWSAAREEALPEGTVMLLEE